MSVSVLFREDLDTEGELDVCKHYLHTSRYRSHLRNKLVIGRYSVLPFYQELEAELKSNGCRLVNTYEQHAWIADVLAWAGDASTGVEGALTGLTPKSWSTWASLPSNTSFVVKGKTNSRKFEWNRRMFAKSREDVPGIARSLYDDTMINEQGLVVREYIPLRKLDEGINGLPVSEEWRCFFYRDRLLSKGFYWTNFPEVFDQVEWTAAAETFAHEAAEKARRHADFFVLDIARRADGGWIVIEVNDGQMSGLSLCDPHELYQNLADTFQVGRLSQLEEV